MRSIAVVEKQYSRHVPFNYRFLTRPSFHEAGLISIILLSFLNKKNRPQKIAVKYRIKTIRGYTTIQVPITKGDLLSDGLIYTFN